VGVSVNRKP